VDPKSAAQVKRTGWRDGDFFRPLVRVLLLPRPRQAEHVELVEQRSARDAEELGRARLVARASLERLANALGLVAG